MLPDEYDRIHDDLEPLWGMDPKDVNSIIDSLSNLSGGYTLGHNSSSHAIGILNHGLAAFGNSTKVFLSQAQEVVDTIKNVSHFIPPFRAVFNPFDGPYYITNWKIKAAALKAAATGKCR